MELNSINNILEKVSATLNFFDFSFLVSGTATAGITYYFFHDKVDMTFPFTQMGLKIIFGIIFIYICGILSYSAGKKIRKTIEFSSLEYDLKKFIQIENKIKQNEGYKGYLIDTKNLKNEDFELMYDKMWISLRNHEKGKETVEYLNRAGMMQSIAEGLFFSSILFFCLHLYNYVEPCQCSTYIPLFISILTAYAFLVEANRSAKIQRRELVDAYYQFIIPSSPAKTSSSPED